MRRSIMMLLHDEFNWFINLGMVLLNITMYTSYCMYRKYVHKTVHLHDATTNEIDEPSG